MSTINIRIDDEVKKQAEDLFNRLGLTMAGAFNIFIRQAIREQAIPFRIEAARVPNAETIAAIEEVEQMIEEYRNGSRTQGFSSASEMFAAMDAEDDTEGG